MIMMIIAIITITTITRSVLIVTIMTTILLLGARGLAAGGGACASRTRPRQPGGLLSLSTPHVTYLFYLVPHPP